MLKTRLILIDGIPGSGKTTTGEIIASRLVSRNIPHRFYPEIEDDHPLQIYGQADRPLETAAEADRFAPGVEKRFRQFVDERCQFDGIAVVESWLFQNTISFAFNMGMDRRRILDLMEKLKLQLQKLDPVLIYYYQVDVEKSWRFICQERGPEWTQQVLGPEPDIGRAVADWEPNQAFVYEIVKDWDIPKLVIENRNYRWDSYIRRIMLFLGLA